MKKQEMIKEIQVAEANAWKRLRDMEDAYGTNSEQTERARSAWDAIYALRETLGMPALSIFEMIAMDLLPMPSKHMRVN
jgi:alcohol dehydrogenase class IV